MSNLRVYYHILGTETYYQTVSSVEEAKLVIDSIAKFVNMKVEEGVFPDHCSIAGLEEYDENDSELVLSLLVYLPLIREEHTPS